MRAIPILLLLAALARAEGPSRPDPESIRSGLLASGREAREAAAEKARRMARTDPAGLDALWGGLDLRARCVLVGALGSAGTRHAAMVALRRAADPEPEVFRALLAGLVAGGGKALFAPAPSDLPARRRDALESLRLRWRVERELSKLKAESGPTGHYFGQFAGLLKLGPDAIDILFDIVRDRRRPLPGEGAAGPHASIHPAMVRFERRELRTLVAYAFGEVIREGDIGNRQRLYDLFKHYWNLDEDDYPYESRTLASSLAYSLHDLGIKEPGEWYLRHLRRQAEGGRLGFRSRNAVWQLGYAYIRLGHHELGEYYYRQILQMRTKGVSRYIAAYNLACNFSMRAMQEPRRRTDFTRLSLDYLEEAVRLNWWDWRWMEEDGDLSFIRKEPRYQAVLRKLQEKWPDRRKGKHSKKPEDFLGPPGKR